MNFQVLSVLNRIVCQRMYHVTVPEKSPLPEEGPLLLVADHSSVNDPMVLLATAGRHIHFLMAREIYEQPHLRWVFQAFQCIPVSRGISDVVAIRTMLRILKQGQVVGIFPEGGLDNFRDETGHRGVAYLSLKTGTSIVPASICWNAPRPSGIVRSLFTPGRVHITYGIPIFVNQESSPARDHLLQTKDKIMEAIRALRR